MTYLTAFFELFRFVKRYRERRLADIQRAADERAAEREHQAHMLETIFTKMVDAQKVQGESLIAIAEAMRAQAAVQQSWLDGFKIQDPTPMRPVVANTDEEAWVKEALELQKLGLVDIDLNAPNLPPEFKLAFALAHGQDEDESSEG